MEGNLTLQEKVLLKKENVTIRLSRGVIAEARRRRINISQFTNEKLQDFFGKTDNFYNTHFGPFKEEK